MNALQCIVNGEENPQNCPFLLAFCNPARGQTTAIGNMHKKFGKDRVCGSRDMLMTDRQTCSSQYFATTPMGEVTMAA